MKSGKEISQKIDRELETERQAQIKEAISLIDETSEVMFEKSIMKMPIPNAAFRFSKAIKEDEVKKVLEDNGLEIELFDFVYYLVVND